MKSNPRRLGLAAMQAIARSHGGECLSFDYLNTQQKFKWRCQKGHVWEAPGNRVRLGSWCAECVHDSLRLGMEKMHELAHLHGGECLSSEYLHVKAYLLWRCAEGHEWFATPANIRKGNWCRECARQRQREQRLQLLKDTAKTRGGKCLADEYKAGIVKVPWQCHRGHTWMATPQQILHGSWCPECYWLSLCLHDEARKKYLLKPDKK
jgi:hypothetical protein